MFNSGATKLKRTLVLVRTSFAILTFRKSPFYHDQRKNILLTPIPCPFV